MMARPICHTADYQYVAMASPPATPQITRAAGCAASQAELTPPYSDSHSHTGPLHRKRLVHEILTPPATPEQGLGSIDAGNNSKLTSKQSCILSSTKATDTKDASNSSQLSGHHHNLEEVPSTARSFSFSYELLHELGYGVWSKVYSARLTTPKIKDQESLDFHPDDVFTTPRLNSKQSIISQTRPAYLAVKRLSRRDGRRIIEKEARILTYLHCDPHSSKHLVPFHGFEESTCSIIMDAIPLTLDTYCKTFLEKHIPSSHTMRDPLIGRLQWLSLSSQLIAGLAYLQDKRCVHGDIKPNNILIRFDSSSICSDSSTFVNIKPVYCDLSSSHIFSTNTLSAPAEEISAVTTEYISPELLAAFYRYNEQRAIATYASDVYALAVTLLFAATGESPYSIARNELQKVAMAKEGRPLDFARMGSQGSRVRSGEMVDRLLSRAMTKNELERIEVIEWSETVNLEISKTQTASHLDTFAKINT